MPFDMVRNINGLRDWQMAAAGNLSEAANKMSGQAGFARGRKPWRPEREYKATNQCQAPSRDAARHALMRLRRASSSGCAGTFCPAGADNLSEIQRISLAKAGIFPCFALACGLLSDRQGDNAAFVDHSACTRCAVEARQP